MPSDSKVAECSVPASVILRMVERAMQFPYPTICRHLVAADLLSTLEEHGYQMPGGLAHAVVYAHDEDALAILQGSKGGAVNV